MFRPIPCFWISNNVELIVLLSDSMGGGNAASARPTTMLKSGMPINSQSGYKHRIELSSLEFCQTRHHGIHAMRIANSAVKTFQSWLAANHPGESRELHDIPAHNLDAHLENFFSTVIRKNGQNYSANSLVSLRTGLEFHFKRMGYPFSIVTSPEFSSSSRAFKRRREALASDRNDRVPAL